MRKEKFSEENLKLLLNLSDKLASSASVKDELPEIFSIVEKILDANAGIMVINRKIPNLPKIYVHYIEENTTLNKETLYKKIKEAVFKEPFYDNSYSSAAAGIKELKNIGVRKIIVSPLVFQSIFGTLLFFSGNKDKEFTKNDLFLLNLFSRVLAASIKYNHTSYRFRLARKTIDAVLQVNPVLDASLDLQSILDSLLTSALELAPANLAHIFLYNNGKLEFGAARGLDGKWDKPFSEPRKNGLTYTVAKSGKMRIITDIRNDNIFKNKKKEWEGSIVSIPLKIRDRVVGVMNISKFVPGQFQHDSLRIWKLFSNQAAIAIENSRLFSEERRQRLRNEALQSASMVITGSLNLSEVLDHILTEIRKVVPYDSASIMLTEGPKLRVVAGKDLPDKNAIGKSYTTTRLDKIVAETKRPLILKDAKRSKDFKAWGNTEYVRGWMSVPLISRGKMIGCITLDSKRVSSFTKADGEIALNFANQAAIAVENATLHESLKEKLTALEKSQNQLIKSEKLAAIGRLVAGIAHELNNPLTSIIGIAQLLKSTETRTENREYLDRLVSEAARTAEIVRGLLDFTHQREAQYREVNINSIIRETLKLISYDIKSRTITVVKNLSSDIPKTTADPHKIQQVFINLLTNASQAIAESGKGDKIIITTKDKKSNIKTGRDIIQITISDNGPGIPPENIRNIFDPFFSTKPIGKGTGLGLSVCHGIIDEHRGKIWAESEHGKGAKFIIELPVISVSDFSTKPREENGTIEREPSLAVSANFNAANTASILVVEDDETLRTLMVRYLKKQHYHVDSAADGNAAIRHIKTNNYNLVISDIKMPKMNGIELYKQIKEIKPLLADHFIAATGDVISEESNQFILKTDIPYLKKPFEMEKMLQAVIAVLKKN